MVSYQHYINGEWKNPSSERWFESYNPYSGEAWATIPQGTADDVEKAVAAAKNAFKNGWADMKLTQRGKYLYKLADLIERDAAHLAETELRDNGKLIAEMLAQLKSIPEWYRYYGGLADKVEGSVIPTEKPDVFNFTQYEPMGVIGIITPWNSSILLLTSKLAPLLAAGNTAVIKPSQYNSASTLELMRLVEKAGLPIGVVNTVTGFGSEVGAAIVELSCVTFFETGALPVSPVQ